MKLQSGRKWNEASQSFVVRGPHWDSFLVSLNKCLSPGSLPPRSRSSHETFRARWAFSTGDVYTVVILDVKMGSKRTNLLAKTGHLTSESVNIFRQDGSSSGPSAIQTCMRVCLWVSRIQFVHFSVVLSLIKWHLLCREILVLDGVFLCQCRLRMGNPPSLQRTRKTVLPFPSAMWEFLNGKTSFYGPNIFFTNRMEGAAKKISAIYDSLMQLLKVVNKTTKLFGCVAAMSWISPWRKLFHWNVSCMHVVSKQNSEDLPCWPSSLPTTIWSRKRFKNHVLGFLRCSGLGTEPEAASCMACFWVMLEWKH